MANGSALVKAGKLQGRHGRSRTLRVPDAIATAPVKPFKPLLSGEAKEILARMRAEEDFYPDIDETLLILCY